MSELCYLTIMAFFVGWLYGSTSPHNELFRMCVDQQLRGDYWFDKYMSVVRDDWEPISEEPDQ